MSATAINSSVPRAHATNVSSLSAPRSKRQKKEKSSSNQIRLIDAVANQALARLVALKEPLVVSSKRELVTWIASKVIDHRRIKRHDKRLEIGWEVVELFYELPRHERRVVIAPYMGGRGPRVVTVTEAGRSHLRELCKQAHPSTGSIKTVRRHLELIP